MEEKKTGQNPLTRVWWSSPVSFSFFFFLYSDDANVTSLTYLVSFHVQHAMLLFLFFLCWSIDEKSETSNLANDWRRILNKIWLEKLDHIEKKNDEALVQIQLCPKEIVFFLLAHSLPPDYYWFWLIFTENTRPTMNGLFFSTHANRFVFLLFSRVGSSLCVCVQSTPLNYSIILKEMSCRLSISLLLLSHRLKWISSRAEWKVSCWIYSTVVPVHSINPIENPLWSPGLSN